MVTFGRIPSVAIFNIWMQKKRDNIIIINDILNKKKDINR